MVDETMNVLVDNAVDLTLEVIELVEYDVEHE